MFTQFCWRNFKEKDGLEDPVVDGRIILNCHFKEKDGGCGLGRSESGQDQGPGYFQSDNELSGYKKKMRGISQGPCSMGLDNSQHALDEAASSLQ